RVDARMVDRVETRVRTVDRIEERQHVHAAEEARQRPVQQRPKLSETAAREPIRIRDQLDFVSHLRPFYRRGRRGYDAIVCRYRKAERSEGLRRAHRAPRGGRMRNPGDAVGSHGTLALKALTCTMFFTFAMTTDAVGSVIPELLREFDLSLTAAGAFHYVPMIAIAAGGLALGFLADRAGRKATIILGLVAYG